MKKWIYAGRGIIMDGEKQVASVTPIDGKYENAKLIEASPLMYKLLRDILDTTIVDNEPPKSFLWDRWRNKMARIVNSIEGQ